MIEHYEPHGSIFTHPSKWTPYDGLAAQFKRYLPKYTYKPPSTICPTLNYGFQSKIGMEDTTKELKGTCTMWSLYFLNDRLQHPEQTAYEVYLNTYKKLKTTMKRRSLNEEIKGFISMLAKLLNLRLVPVICTIDMFALEALVLKNKVPIMKWQLEQLNYISSLKQRNNENYYHLQEVLVEEKTSVAKIFDVKKQAKLSKEGKEALQKVFLRRAVTSCLD